MATSVKKTQTERERERTLDGGEREREKAWKKARVYWYPFSGHRTSPNGGTFVLIRNPRRVIRSTGPRWIGKWPVGQQAKKGKVGGQEGGFTLVTRPIHRQATDEPPCASCAVVLRLLRLVSPCHAVNPIRDTDQSSARSCLYAASLLRLPRPALDRYLRTRTVLSVARLPHAQKKHLSCWNNFHRSTQHSNPERGMHRRILFGLRWYFWIQRIQLSLLDSWILILDSDKNVKSKFKFPSWQIRFEPIFKWIVNI